MRRWLTLVLFLSGILALILFCSPAGATVLLQLLEMQSRPVRSGELRHRVDAIVVVSGRPERADFAAELHLATGLPLAMLGRMGIPATPDRSMLVIAEVRHGVYPRWVEEKSRDTRQNAVAARCLLWPEGIRRIALVTDAFHMPRARAHFEAVGFEVVPAPATDWLPPRAPLTPRNFMPSVTGWRMVEMPLKEWLGLLFAPVERLFEPPVRCSHQPPNGTVARSWEGEAAPKSDWMGENRLAKTSSAGPRRAL